MIIFIQILIGLTQLFIGAIRLLSIEDNKAAYAHGIVMYWVLVIVYFLQLWLATHSPFDEIEIPERLAIVYLFAVPWFIAGYYWYVIYILKEPVKEEQYILFCSNRE